MKIIALLLFGLSVGGCITTTAEEKAYSACLETVPAAITQAAEGEIDVYQIESPVALTKDNRLTGPTSFGSEPHCSPACQDARDEKYRIVTDCLEQWRKIHPTQLSNMENLPEK